MSSSHVVTSVICSIVAIGTLVGLWGGWSRSTRILRALKPGLSLARRLAADPEPARAFSQQWSALDRAFRSSAVVAPLWIPFAATVVPSARAEDAGTLSSTAPPEDWFQVRHLAAGGWSDSAMARLAGLLVSLGILGTFLGLTLGLVEADFGGIQALDSADERTLALQAAMFGLLAGSSTAFVTSVAGLTGSLILTAVVRLGMSRPVDRALAEAASLIRMGVRVEPPSLRLVAQLERVATQPSVAETLQPMLERLQQALEARAEAMVPPPVVSGPGIEQVLQDLLVAVRGLDRSQPAAEPAWASMLVARLEAPAAAPELPAGLQDLLVEQQERLSRVVDAFAVHDRRLVVLDARIRSVADAISDATAPRDELELASLTEVLGRLAAQLEASPTAGPVASERSALAAAASTAMEDSVRITLAPTLESLTRVSRTFAEASRRFDEATVRLEAAAHSNETAGQSLRIAAESLGTRLAVLQQSTAALRTGLAHHTDASTALTTAAATLHSVGPQLATAADQVKLGARSMELTAERLSALQVGRPEPELRRVVEALEALVSALEAR